MTAFEIRPAGDSALLLAAADPVALAERITGIDGVAELVPAAETVLVLVRGPDRLEQVRTTLTRLADEETGAVVSRETAADPVIEVPVHYDGADLAAVAEHLGTSTAEVVAAHTGTVWHCAFVGFAPGFGYLRSPDGRLAVPRRDRPRTAIPAGAVALAGGYSAIYPRATPGGWQLIGHTDIVLWDLDRDPPALLHPGAAVRFVDARVGSRGSSPGRGGSLDDPASQGGDLGNDGSRSRSGPSGSGASRDESGAPADAPKPVGASEAAVPQGTPAGPSRAAAISAEGRAPGASGATSSPALRVERVGPAVTVQDLGRPGWTGDGVGRSGAADAAALTLANRLVGNPEGAAALEILVGGVTLRALRPLTVAVTGAPLPATVNGTPVGHASVLTLPTGSVLALGATAVGLRGYLAVRGGIVVPPVLGSCSRDTLAGLGPAPIEAGAELAAGPPPREWPIVDQAPLPPPPEQPVPVRVRLGPRDDWFADPRALCAGAWRVTGDTDRVGVRLARADGPELTRTVTTELPTEGMPLGAIQVPPGGEPVIMLADHPVTGGYPVIGVIAAADLGRVAQLRPGDRLRFVPEP